jgi:polysaccharide pyruvyl transferase WcaK-like protein
MRSNFERDLYGSAVRAFARGIRASSARRGRDVRSGRVLIVPPARNRGSLGDEAMMTALVQRAFAQGARHVSLLSSGPDDMWGIPQTEAEFVPVTTSIGAYTEAFRFVVRVARYEQCYVIGADVLDGYYSESTALRLLRLAAAAAAVDVPCTITGFSLNAMPRATTVHALRRLPAGVRLVCRDAVSQHRVLEHVGRPAELSADLAFLLEPSLASSTAREAIEWIEGQKREGRLVIGVNAKPLGDARCSGWTDDDLIVRYREMLEELARDDTRASFVLMPHDVRPGIGDVDVLSRVVVSLPPAVRARCHTVRPDVGARDVKGICGKLDAVVSARMHLAIAALGQGIPVACITYQGKFEGLFHHFQLDDLTIEPAKALVPGALTDFAREMLRRRVTIRSALTRALPRVLILAEKNLAGLGRTDT